MRLPIKPRVTPAWDSMNGGGLDVPNVLYKFSPVAECGASMIGSVSYSIRCLSNSFHAEAELIYRRESRLIKLGRLFAMRVSHFPGVSKMVGDNLSPTYF